MSMVNSLISKGEFDKVIDVVYSERGEKRFSGLANQALYAFVERKDWDRANKIWEIIGVEPKDVSDKGRGIVAVRQLLELGDLSNALTVYHRLVTKGNARKSHLTMIIEKLTGMGAWSQAVELFLESSFPVVSSDVAQLLKKKLPFELRLPILKKIKGLPLTFTTEDIDLPDGHTFSPPIVPTLKGSTETKKLKLIDFSLSELDQLIKPILEQCRLKKSLVHMENFISTCTGAFSYVIDGANIMYYGHRVLNLASYQKLDLVVREISRKAGDPNKVLLVLNQRHASPQIKKSDIDVAKKYLTNWSRFCKIQWTPRGVNDDLYSISATLKNSNCYLVSNDLFRDHICYLKSTGKAGFLFAQWYQERVIKYNILRQNTVVELDEPLGWSNRIQEPYDGWFALPMTNQWLLIATTQTTDTVTTTAIEDPVSVKVKGDL